MTSDTIRDSQTSLEPILVALEHIEARGSLLSFAHDHARRVRLMKVMTEIALVTWNAVTKKYQLTQFGCQCLAASRDLSSETLDRWDDRVGNARGRDLDNTPLPTWNVHGTGQMRRSAEVTAPAPAIPTRDARAWIGRS